MLRSREGRPQRFRRLPSTISHLWPSLRKYRSIYKNWKTATLHSLTRTSPKFLVLRDGRTIQSNKFGSLKTALWTLPRLAHDGWEIGFSEPYFIVSKKFDGNVKISLMCTQGNLQSVDEVFVDKIYDGLFEGKTVVDIGMNMGDSSIFFALRGAKKVLGIEPIPSAYRLALRNIEANNLTNRITPVQVAVAADDSYVEMSNFWDESGGNLTVDYTLGIVRNIKPDQYIRVRGVTLAKILEDHGVERIDFLKIDCEGCEYEIFKTLTRDVFQKISEVAIEYHWLGPKPITDVLEHWGFEVVLRPGGRGIGLIRAVKKTFK